MFVSLIKLLVDALVGVSIVCGIVELKAFGKCWANRS